MKRIFTICVPDDCYLKVANIVALVEKDDHSDNGITIFTADNNDEGQEWLFTTNGKAKKVVEPQESEE
jgi:arylsulfatase A-like enzyme